MDSIFIAPELETQELIAEFTIDGEPISKARARFTKYGSKTVAYTPQKTLDGEDAVKSAYLNVTHKIETDPEVTYAVRARFYSGTRQRRDVDNMVKLILDGLNKVAWVDDNQVLEIAARKSFVKKSEARTSVQIFRIGDMDFPKKNCIRCGTMFRIYASTEASQQYCTAKCYNDGVREKSKRTCEMCGVSFTAVDSTSVAKCCSKECSYALRRTLTNCAICGLEFSIQRCHVRKNNYCSSECIREYDRQVHRSRKSSYFPGTCAICGSGTTRKEYIRCNPCKLQGAKGKPKPAMSEVITEKQDCSVDDCSDKARTRGMCKKHYTRWYREQQAPDMRQGAMGTPGVTVTVTDTL